LGDEIKEVELGMAYDVWREKKCQLHSGRVTSRKETTSSTGTWMGGEY